ncbi:MAG: hypothetical protein OEW04_09035 [Nitrospirota bacterium]|nr:hypothetical protein [Nitrospirota bacterium]
MKCPRCGADIAGQKVCGNCGTNGVDDRMDIEVQYKDFKTSELLEIRQIKHPAPPFEETNAEGEQTEIFHRAKKRSFPVLAIALLILALITGAFFVIRYLALP